MLKKIITTALLGVSSLGVMAANAATPGVYISGQLGYANTHMDNKINIYNDVSTALPYVENVFFDKKIISNNGIAGRLALGYQFNQNLAVELGYMQIRNKKIMTQSMGDEGTLDQYAIDLAIKGILPIASNFNVYSKLGVAYLTTTGVAKFNLVTRDEDYTPAKYLNSQYIVNLNDVAKRTWAPEAAIGVSYDITPNVSVDTSWTHIQPVGKNRPGNIDFVAVGLGYHFG